MSKRRKNDLRKKYQKRLRKARQKLAEEIMSTAYPQMSNSQIQGLIGENNIYFQRGMEGKWIDGSDLTTEQEQFMDLMVANEMKAMFEGASPEKREKLFQLFENLQGVNEQISRWLKII